MMLDSGICTIFQETSSSVPGGKPVKGYEMLSAGWYGLLQFESLPAWPTEGREEKEVSLRIRVLRDIRIDSKCVVALQLVYELSEDVERYEVARVYHGVDDESGEEISDLTLRRVEA